MMNDKIKVNLRIITLIVDYYSNRFSMRFLKLFPKRALCKHNIRYNKVICTENDISSIFTTRGMI